MKLTFDAEDIASFRMDGSLDPTVGLSKDSYGEHYWLHISMWGANFEVGTRDCQEVHDAIQHFFGSGDVKSFEIEVTQNTTIRVCGQSTERSLEMTWQERHSTEDILF